MLIELSIKDFAIIDELTLAFAPGFNVLTGETGAGKSIIIDAVDLLLGGRADATMVRASADLARIEGTFKVAGGLGETIRPILEREELLDDDGQTLVLARELRREGRNVCRVNGRTVSLAILKEIGQNFVDVHGQSEHLSLLRVREHLYLLDRYAGLDTQRSALAALARELNEVRRELADLVRGERDAARRMDLLNFQINEITAAKLKPGEDKTLLEERTRLANAEKLAALAEEAVRALYEGSDEQASASDLLGQAARAIGQLAAIDSSLAENRDLAQSLAEQLSELARDLSNYHEGIEFNPKRLDQVEERLDLVKTLSRKYGDAPGTGSIESIIAHGERARAELDGITHAGERIEVLQKRETELLKKIGKAGADLSAARRRASEQLARGIEVELQDLRMAGAKFGVDLQWEEAEDGAIVPEHVAKGIKSESSNSGKPPRYAFDSTGLDRIEFVVAPNPGEGLKPLAKIASGGETSRLMLALKGVLARADRTPTLIFDEIDQGIGGRVGAIVGRKLWGLSSAHQVLCITHLPQLAGFGDAHFKVEKQIEGERTLTHVRPLGGPARVAELAQMLGLESEKTTESAEEILEMVRREKGQRMGNE
ncbi:MAG: DNA repair protein RecN [Chloroflexi bacterium]|nr:DNA repair protein RecN [Chloroflexota bacterium]